MSSVVGQPSEHDSERLRILFVTSDKFPPFRPAAKSISRRGRRPRPRDRLGLPGGGCTARAAHAQETVPPTLRQPTRRREIARIRKYWSDLRNDWDVFGLLRPHEYSLVQIKDKYIGALWHRRREAPPVPIFYWLAYPHGEASSYARGGPGPIRAVLCLRGIGNDGCCTGCSSRSAHVFVQSERMREDIARTESSAKMTPVPSPSTSRIDALAAAPDRQSAETDRLSRHLAARAALRLSRSRPGPRTRARTRREVALRGAGGSSPRTERLLERKESERLAASRTPSRSPVGCRCQRLGG